MLDLNFEIFLRLVASVVLGGMIGFERGINHDAGLRTHIIVCLGAASIMILSEAMVAVYDISSEVMRMSAQVVSGVGFLGAGSIIVDGNRVRGITTAAGLWTTACVGLVVGAGYYLIAFSVVVLMLASMLGLKSLKNKLRHKGTTYNVKLETSSASQVQRVFEKLVSESATIKNLRIEEVGETSFMLLELKLPSKVTVEDLVKELCQYSNVREFTML